MKQWSKFLALLAVLALVAAACGGDGGSGTTAAPDEPGTTQAAESPDTTAAPEEPSDTTGGGGGEGGDIATDIGVDIEAGTIKIGLLSDLSGPFSPLVQQIVTAHEFYWGAGNPNVGFNALRVDRPMRATAYDGPTHSRNTRGSANGGRVMVHP